MLLSEPGKVIRCADHLQVLLALPAETIDLILAAPGKQEFFKKAGHPITCFGGLRLSSYGF